MKAALSYQASMSANDGSYAFANLQPGDDTVQASATSLLGHYRIYC